MATSQNFSYVASRVQLLCNGDLKQNSNIDSLEAFSKCSLGSKQGSPNPPLEMGGRKLSQEVGSFRATNAATNGDIDSLASATNGHNVHENVHHTIQLKSIRFMKVIEAKEVFSEDEDGSGTSEDEEGNGSSQNHWEFPEETLKEYGVDERDDNTADSWIRRHPTMVRLTGRHPFNSEPPLGRLMSHGFITPCSIHYVRNHGYVPKAEWQDWEVEICGLVKRSTKLKMDDLLALPLRELPVTLVCAGNRRKEQNMVQKSIGFNWGAAAISTSVWRGVRLCDLLRRCGILSKKKGARFVSFEGAEKLPGGGGSCYGTTISIDIALDESRDVLVAFLQNGKLLEPDHGFPVRVIIPGFIGGRMVKWLKKIEVTSKESDNYYHVNDNKVLPSHVNAEKASAEGWWYKSDYVINELNVNSVITTPTHGEMIQIGTLATHSPYKIAGYAYSGGGRKVIRVEITFDEGQTWQLCKLHRHEKPTEYGKYWCWCLWELEVEVIHLLNVQTMAVRAWDAAMNTQPQDLTWNVMGMMNNCWFKIHLNTCKSREGGLGIRFEHPTCPGNLSGGWMLKHNEESSQVNSKSGLVKSASSPFLKLGTKSLSMSEVRKHNKSDSAWIVVHGVVYDCTRFLKDHPGGADSILLNVGTDCTEEFDAIHSDKAKALLEDFQIGKLADHLKTPDSSLHDSEMALSALTLAPIQEVSSNQRLVALNPTRRITCKLLQRKELTQDLRLFRFSLPLEDHVLGLPVGKHIFVLATIEGKLCMRSYTPISSDDAAVGYFDLLVRVYLKGVNPVFPEGGKMSQHLNNLQIGEEIDVKGPVGNIYYMGKGNFMVNGESRSAKKISMLAGGTGITPCYQIIKAILGDSKDHTEVHLIYANRNEEDIMLRSELDQWQHDHQNFKIWYVLSKFCPQNWSYSTGYITYELLKMQLPEASSDSVVFICGPPAMVELACLPNLERLGYDRNHCFVF